EQVAVNKPAQLWFSFERVLVSDFAHATRSVMVIMDGPARGRVESRDMIHQKPIEMAPALQFQTNRPDSVHTLVHGVRRRRIITPGRSDHQLDVMRLRGFQSEYGWLGKGVLTWRHPLK